jgi:hypothetical protein
MSVDINQSSVEVWLKQNFLSVLFFGNIPICTPNFLSVYFLRIARLVFSRISLILELNWLLD